MSLAEFVAMDGSFAVRRGDAKKRLDVNYNALSPIVESRLADARYPLKTIGQVAVRLQYGCSKRATTEPVGVPILRMNNLQEDGWVLDDLKYVQLNGKELAAWRLQPGDIVFNRTNSKELVGKCEVFRESGTWVFASYLMRLQVDEDVVIPDYLVAFLNCPTGRAQIDRESRQIIGMSNINAEEIRTLRIPVPKPSIQKRLVDDLERARSSYRAKLAQADALLSSIDGFVLRRLGLTLPPSDSRIVYALRLGQMRQRFDVDYNSPRFRMLRAKIEAGEFASHTVDTVFHPITSGFAAGGDDQTDDLAVGIPHIRPLNITSTAELRLDGTKMVPRSQVDSRDLLVKGELLFNNTNSTAWVGKTVVFDLDIECACSNHITRLRLRDIDYNSYFFSSLFNALRSLGFFGLVSTNFNNQAGINTETLKAIRIPVPGPDVQADIANEITRYRADARRLRTEAREEWNSAKQAFEGSLFDPASTILSSVTR
jgi:type I restriction enzyme S subunit